MAVCNFENEKKPLYDVYVKIISPSNWQSESRMLVKQMNYGLLLLERAEKNYANSPARKGIRGQALMKK